MGKNGCLYIYVSNETPNVDVFFDNLQVTHTRGPVLEETHYYPFGLTMNAISSKALNGIADNNKKFNKGTELNIDFDINLYETPFRSYDPQVGRFHQIDVLANLSDDWSQYVFGSNNPILRNDPLGLIDTVVNGEKGETKQLDNLVLSSRKRKKPELPFPTASQEKPISASVAFSPTVVVATRGGGGWVALGAFTIGCINYAINGPSLEYAINEAYIESYERLRQWAEETVANIDATLAALAKLGGSQEKLYELYTITPGTYKYLKGGRFWKLLEEGEVELDANATWKYGTSKQSNIIGGPGKYPARYSPGKVPGLGSIELFSGTRPQVYAMQAYYIARYFLKHGDLPPGNKANF